MSLRIDYKDDVLSANMNGKRRYTLIQNEDGTVSLTDETVYSQTGDSYGAADINNTNKAVNQNTAALGGCKIQVLTALPANPDSTTIYLIKEA